MKVGVEMKRKRYDPAEKCPKCGSGNIHVRFIPSYESIFGADVLHCKCRNCENLFSRAPLDAKSEEVES